MKNRYKIISFVLVLILLLSTMCVASGATFNPYKEDVSFKYYKEILLALEIPSLSEEEMYKYYQYLNILEYNADGSPTSDEATPDYVFCLFTYSDYSYAGCMEVIGDYIVSAVNIYIPYDLGLHIFSINDNRVYTLKEAWEAQLPQIEEILDYVGDRIGDVNYDDEVNIKDATLIQKHLANLEIIHDYYEGYPKYISDFNRDGERNVKDATAIQKYIAGLPY